MLPGTIRPLTKRQRAVMERIDNRIPIKIIALELGVSETRINQHIRALKDIYGAASLSELVAKYRISQGR
ncbi:MAG: LuxR C-terminal-related transcriptional regulator, partial [Paracoccaceae bacterium]